MASDRLSVDGWRDFDSEFDAARHLVLSTIDAVWQDQGSDLLRFVVTEAPRLSFALVILSYTLSEPGRSAFWNLRSPELFESLGSVLLSRLQERFGPGKPGLMETEGDNAIYVLTMWSRLGKDAARPDLEAVMDANPELWARLVKSSLDPFGELMLKELASVFDPAWLLRLGERYRTSLQADPAALRVLEILRGVPGPQDGTPSEGPGDANGPRGDECQQG